MNKEIFDELVEEFRTLTDKIKKCKDFIIDDAKFNELDSINKDLMIAQLKAMETYASVLGIRIGVNTVLTTSESE